ncbi:hypothetical protein MPER_00905, partial [Moniliophthora perniciosa FA553]
MMQVPNDIPDAHHYTSLSRLILRILPRFGTIFPASLFLEVSSGIKRLLNGKASASHPLAFVPVMSSTIPEELAPLLSVQRTVVFPIATFSALYFFYGLYVVLFGACVHMMRSRHPGDEKLNRNLYLSLTVLLFVFSTIYVVVYTIDESTGSIVRFNAVETHEYQPLEDLYTTNIEETTFLSIEVLLASFLKYAAPLLRFKPSRKLTVIFQHYSGLHADSPLPPNLGLQKTCFYASDSNLSPYKR